MPISGYQIESGHPPIGMGMSSGITKGCMCFMFQSTIVKRAMHMSVCIDSLAVASFHIVQQKSIFEH